MTKSTMSKWIQSLYVSVECTEYIEGGDDMMNGILPLWKPKGMTSHDCVFKLSKLLRTKKVDIRAPWTRMFQVSCPFVLEEQQK